MESDTRFSDDFERSAAGLDYDDSIREKASHMGASLAEGPEALFDQIEELLPSTWKEQIAQFPLTSVLVGLAVGMFLGMRKGNEILTAGSAMISAAATANISKILEHVSED